MAYCVDQIDWLSHHNWPGLNSVICVRSTRRIGDQVSQEDRDFLSSLSATNPNRLLSLLRGHWSIENQLHWSWDVQFGEDQSRVRSGHASENFAALRRVVLSLLKNETTFDGSLKRKRKRCSRRRDYLMTVLKAGEK